MDDQNSEPFVIHEGELFQNGVSIPASITGSFTDIGAGPIPCRVVIRKDDWEPPLGYGKAPIQLKGKTVEGVDIRASGFQANNGIYDALVRYESVFIFEGNVQTLFFGYLDEFVRYSGKIICAIAINPTPIAKYAMENSKLIQNQDGTISRSNKKNNRGIRWTTSLGEAELITLYGYKDAKINIFPAVMQIKVDYIIIAVKPSRKSSLYTILSSLEETLSTSLLLLSFLGRQPTTWCQAQAIFTPSSRSLESPHEAFAKYEPWPGYDYQRVVNPLPSNIPVRLEALGNGLFQEFLNRYEDSSIRQTLHQVIQYLLASYELNPIEVRIGIMYTALESLVSGLSEQHQLNKLMKAKDFERFREDLHDHIRTYFLKKEDKEGEIVQAIVKKLSELQRPPFSDQLKKLLQLYDLDSLFLMHDNLHGTPLLEALQQIQRRRNKYIHQGKIDTIAHYEDFYILQELLELWVLKLLNCPIEAINLDGYHYIDPSGDKQRRHMSFTVLDSIFARRDPNFRSIIETIEENTRE